jgi:hypothetical protein
MYSIGLDIAFTVISENYVDQQKAQ